MLLYINPNVDNIEKRTFLTLHNRKRNKIQALIIVHKNEITDVHLK